uniref:Uncharacterized protein n=1 Tax=Oryza rufipogon TaxID=4529 RepID=A0A0E0QM00_ORYRU
MRQAVGRDRGQEKEIIREAHNNKLATESLMDEQGLLQLQLHASCMVHDATGAILQASSISMIRNKIDQYTNDDDAGNARSYLVCMFVCSVLGLKKRKCAEMMHGYSWEVLPPFPIKSHLIFFLS